MTDLSIMECIGMHMEPDGQFTLAGRSGTLQEWEENPILGDLLQRATFEAGLAMAQDVADLLLEMRRAARRARRTK